MDEHINVADVFARQLADALAPRGQDFDNFPFEGVLHIERGKPDEDEQPTWKGFYYLVDLKHRVVCWKHSFFAAVNNDNDAQHDTKLRAELVGVSELCHLSEPVSGAYRPELTVPGQRGGDDITILVWQFARLREFASFCHPKTLALTIISDPLVHTKLIYRAHFEHFPYPHHIGFKKDDISELKAIVAYSGYDAFSSIYSTSPYDSKQLMDMLEYIKILDGESASRALGS
jgi:hypothetical protein